MTGIEKILAQIQADTDSTCTGIRDNAYKKCADIISDAQYHAQIIKDTAGSDAQRIKEEIIKRAHSSAKLKRQTVILEAKQRIISTSLESARKYLLDLPNVEYFNLICKMISKYSKSSEGELCFSQRDLARISAEEKKKIKNIAKNNLVISNVPVNITGGFIIKYGAVELNCSFESIFSSNHEKLSDTISHMLFN